MKNEIKLGIILMILATLCFGIMDGVSRYLAEEYNVFIINMYRSWVLVLFVLIYSIKKGELRGTMPTLTKDKINTFKEVDFNDLVPNKAKVNKFDNNSITLLIK